MLYLLKNVYYLQIDNIKGGFLNKGMFLVPVKAIPEIYQKDSLKDKHTHGHIAVIDTVRYSISFVPLKKPANSTRYDDPQDLMLTLKSPKQICSLSTDGILQVG